MMGWEGMTTHWWVLMILVSLTAPLSVCCLSTGRTLMVGRIYISLACPLRQPSHSLGRIGRVDDDGFLGLVVADEVRVVVAGADPCSLVSVWLTM